MEHWVQAPEILRNYARHYQTGEPIPEVLIDKLLAARNFNQGFATVEYTACAMIDLELHARADDKPVDIAQFERDFLARVGMPAEIGLRHRPTHFQHLFDGAGYAAGYYAYLWAEVLDADGYAAFTDAGDVFDPALAAKLKVIYSAGDTEDPMVLYREFRGRDPAIDALLAQRGLDH
jgi:peptidyl-dipeptidase Dcp